MSRRRLHRLSVSIFVMLALLFSQLALASYICPWLEDAQRMAQMAAAGASCEGMDTEQPALCQQYAAEPGKTFEAVKLPAATLPAVVRVLELPRLLDGGRAGAAVAVAASQLRPPPDPLFLSTLRLRV